MTIEEHPLEPFLPKNAKMLFLGSFPPPKARWSMEFYYPNWINDFWRIMGLIHFNDKAYFEEIPNTLKGGFEKRKRFDKERIVEFCLEKGIALFDTARKVCRLKDNADDNFLEIVEGTDVFELLEKMPECMTIVTTGGKASEELQAYFHKKGIEVKIPKVGESVSYGPPRSPLQGESGISSLSLEGGAGGGHGEAGISSLSPEGGAGGDHGEVGISSFSLEGGAGGGHGEVGGGRWWRMPSSSRAYPMKLEKKAEYYRRLFL